MTLNIPLVESSKVKPGAEFYIIKPILKKKWDKSKIKSKIIKQKGADKEFRILQYSVFENVNTVFDFFDYKLFRVGKTKDDVIKYYRKLYGNSFLKQDWIILVLKLKSL